MRGLTPKQQRFVEEYLVDLNASAALLRAGYKSRNPDVDGHQLLVKPSISAAIGVARAALSARTEITQDRVMADIEAIKQDAMQAVYDADGNKAMLDHKSALRACELQGKHIGMFVEKTETKLSVDAVPKLEIVLNK
jgi:phage terminase small subunit